VDQFTIASGWSGHGIWVGDGPEPDEGPDERARCNGPGTSSVSCPHCAADQEAYRRIRDSGAVHVSEILSVMTGIFVGRNFEVIQWLLERVTGHGVPHERWQEAASVVRPELVRQLPWLKEIPAPDLSSKADCEAWVASVAALHGEWHVLDGGDESGAERLNQQHAAPEPSWFGGRCRRQGRHSSR
jgi:hypothetical protein